MSKYLIVEGVTIDGDKFRPSDWIDRVASFYADHTNGRLRYTKELHPSLFNGNRVLRVDCALEQDKPVLWKEVQRFIQVNELRVHCIEE